MKKIILFAALIATGALCLCAQEWVQNDTQIATDNRLAELRLQKASLVKQMHQVRVTLIKSDPTLIKLHKKIMALHKEMALNLDRKEEMKPLIEKYKDIEEEILKLNNRDEN